MSQDTLHRLTQTIRGRRNAGADRSYTRKLLDGGPSLCARKFGEEAVETIIAAMQDDPAALTAEAADALFHLLVLLEARGVELSSVMAVLEERMGTSGLAEKAARNAGPS